MIDQPARHQAPAGARGPGIPLGKRAVLRARTLIIHPPALVQAAIAVALLQVVVVLAFVIPGHNAKPHGLPVAVVGPSAATTGLIQHLGQKGRFHVVKLRDDAQARQAIRSRQVYGAFLLDQRRPSVLTASAASIAADQLITAAATQFHVPPGAIRDLVPLTANDPRGAAFNLLVLPLLTTSVIGALVAQMLMGHTLSLRKRLLALGAVAALAAVSTTVIIGPVFGIVPGSFLWQAVLLTLAVGGLILVSDALIRLTGPIGVGLALFVFLVIGNPASGVTTAPEFVPAPWRQIGEIIPPGPIVAALRNTAYFHGAALAKPVTALAGVLLAGLLLQVMTHRQHTARSQPIASSGAADASSPDPAAATGSIGA